MPGLYTRFAAGLLFPLHEAAKRHTSVGVRRELERTQWWSPAQLEALQLQRLRGLLQTIGAEVPYWRSLFQRVGFDPARVERLQDLQRLPLLTKSEIRTHAESMKRPGAQGLSRFATGGSSGEPLTFFIGRERVSHDVAAKWRATRWWGVDIGDPEIVVWGSPIELGAQDRLRAVRDRLLRTELLPAFQMDGARLDAMLAAIRRRRPRMLFGYPSSLSVIARHARSRGVAMDDLGVRVAFVTSERLYDEQRALIEETFGCPVANGYGGRDAGFIAHQCPQGGLHLTAEDVIVEIVGPDGRVLPAGEAGEVVVTHLATSDFPFVRYRTGDVAVLDDRRCACGRGLPMLREVQGRTTDFVVAADGTVMHGLALIYVLREIGWVQSFRIEQVSRSRTEVRVVADDAERRRPQAAAIAQALRRRLGAAVDVDVQFVERIAPEASGKFRYVVSRVVDAAGTPIEAPPPAVASVEKVPADA